MALIKIKKYPTNGLMNGDVNLKAIPSLINGTPLP